MVKPLWKTAWTFQGTQGIEVSYDPAIPFVGLGPEKITIQTDMCIFDFQGSTIYNKQALESTKMSTDRKMRTMRTSIH